MTAPGAQGVEARIASAASGRTVRPADVVRGYARTWAAGDLEAILAYYADDVVLHWFGQNPLSGSHRGKDAALIALGRAAAVMPRQLVDVEAVLGDDSSSSAALVVRERWGDVDLRRVLVYKVVGSHLAECWVFDEDQALVDRMWAGA